MDKSISQCDDQVMIRKATLQDLAELTRLLDLYRQFYGQASDHASIKRFVQERLEKGDSTIFVADTEGVRLGGFTQLYPSFTTIGLQRIWILNDLFVDPTFRSQGFGEGLIKAAVDFSKASGARNLSLQTALTNTPAKKLYERLGWKKNEQFLTYDFYHP